MLMTTNNYLALRDSEQMGQVYRFLGLSVAAGVQANEEHSFTNAEKKEMANAVNGATAETALAAVNIETAKSLAHSFQDTD